MLQRTQQPLSKKNIQTQQLGGLQQLTPIYGQTIATAPMWGGPLELPPLPDAVPLPPKPDATKSILGDIFGTIATIGTAALFPEAALFAPIAGTLVKTGIEDI